MQNTATLDIAVNVPNETLKKKNQKQMKHTHTLCKRMELIMVTSIVFISRYNLKSVSLIYFIYFRFAKFIYNYIFSFLVKYVLNAMWFYLNLFYYYYFLRASNLSWSLFTWQIVIIFYFDLSKPNQFNLILITNNIIY